MAQQLLLNILSHDMIWSSKHRLDSSNKIIRVAVFLTCPSYLTLVSPNYRLMTNNGAGLGLLELIQDGPHRHDLPQRTGLARGHEGSVDVGKDLFGQWVFF